MTIQVINNSGQPVADDSAEGSAPEASAPAAKAAEQKDPAESDTATTEDETEKDDSAESEPDEGDGDAEETEKDKPKKKSGAQRRKERAERAEAEAARARVEADHWKAMALKGAGDSKEQPKTEPKPEPAGKPHPDNYETHVEYVEALTDWKLEQREKDREQQTEKSKLEAESKRLLETHHAREKSFAEKTADYVKVLEDVDNFTDASATLEELIVTSENGPEIMYELAKNPEEYERINALHPLAAAREIGKLEAKVAAKESKPIEPKKITNAPKPIEPVSGGKGTVGKSLSDPNLSQAEYEAIRRDQLKRKSASW